VTLVVVGASLAGLRAVEAARQAKFTGRIVLIGAEEHLPYDRPPLSKAFLADAEAQPPTFRTEQGLRDELGVELMLASPATGLDTEQRAVLVGNRAVPYDGVVLATGATARELPLGGGLTGVHTLRTLDDAMAVRRALDAGARTVVIGAGFIGSEVASSARQRGLDVVVVEALPTPLVRAVGEEMGAACADLHRLNGTDLRCGVQVTAVEGAGRVERVLLSDGSVLACRFGPDPRRRRGVRRNAVRRRARCVRGGRCRALAQPGFRSLDAFGALDFRRRAGAGGGPERDRPRVAVRDRAVFLVGLVRQPYPVRRCAHR
jgi:NADPH-dependent 2,4-dienoyl-CoA reductase/sulfur reductase-like enzyme